MVAGTGLEPATLRVIASRRSPSCVVLFSMHSIAPKLALGATSLEKTCHRHLFSSLTQRATLVVLITPKPIYWSKFSRNKKKLATPNGVPSFFGCGDRTWTCDLRVMSPTSYQLLYPAIFTFLARKLLYTKYCQNATPKFNFFEKVLQEGFFLYKSPAFWYNMFTETQLLYYMKEGEHLC